MVKDLRRLAIAVTAFLVHSSKVEGPATHAVIIGVGAYPHLLGGSAALSPDHDGMGQLSSPPASARRFSHWLVEKLNDPHKPLASVRLLLSEPGHQRFRNPKTGRTFRVHAATMANAEAALEEWRAIGDEDSDNRLIFFFCGHGISQGPETSLLLADYGKRVANPLDGAIDFYRFDLSMDSCAAGEQCYFVDACRASSDTLIEAKGYAGRPIFLPRLGAPRASGPREAPIFFSTLAGEDAYGLPDEPSPFTDALLQALNGAGSDDSEGDWRISTTRLKEAIDYVMKRVGAAGQGQVQIPATGNLTTFFVHYLDGDPEVPVVVGCRPEAANEEAEFICRVGDAELARRPPTPGEWEVTLPAGSYEFVAEFDAGIYNRANVEAYVRPVYRRVPLEVGP